jgi:hypothetical protein
MWVELRVVRLQIRPRSQVVSLAGSHLVSQVHTRLLNQLFVQPCIRPASPQRNHRGSPLLSLPAAPVSDPLVNLHPSQVASQRAGLLRNPAANLVPDQHRSQLGIQLVGRHLSLQASLRGDHRRNQHHNQLPNQAPDLVRSRHLNHQLNRLRNPPNQHRNPRHSQRTNLRGSQPRSHHHFLAVNPAHSRLVDQVSNRQTVLRLSHQHNQQNSPPRIQVDNRQVCQQCSLPTSRVLGRQPIRQANPQHSLLQNRRCNLLQIPLNSQRRSPHRFRPASQRHSPRNSLLIIRLLSPLHSLVHSRPSSRLANLQRSPQDSRPVSLRRSLLDNPRAIHLCSQLANRHRNQRDSQFPPQLRSLPCSLLRILRANLQQYRPCGQADNQPDNRPHSQQDSQLRGRLSSPLRDLRFSQLTSQRQNLPVSPRQNRRGSLPLSPHPTQQIHQHSQPRYLRANPHDSLHLVQLVTNRQNLVATQPHSQPAAPGGTRLDSLPLNQRDSLLEAQRASLHANLLDSPPHNPRGNQQDNRLDNQRASRQASHLDSRQDNPAANQPGSQLRSHLAIRHRFLQVLPQSCLVINLRLSQRRCRLNHLLHPLEDPVISRLVSQLISL